MEFIDKHKREWIIIGVIFFSALNGFFLIRINSMFSRNQEFFLVMEEVNNIPSRLEELKAEIWNVVYQPNDSKDVMSSRSRNYKKILRDMERILDAARVYSTQEKPLEFINRVSRVVNSLARKVDLLSANLVLQKLDTDSTKIFFQGSGSTSMLSDSYVAQMEGIMKRINSSSDVINDDISQYFREQMIVSSETNERDVKEFYCWVKADILINACFLVACLWIFLI